MPEPVTLKASLPYLLTLRFRGVARYAIQLFTRREQEDWHSTQIEKDASSEDYRADTFELDALSPGEEAVLRIAANLTSPVDRDTLRLVAELTQGPELKHVLSRECVLSGGNFASVDLRIELRAA